MVGEAELGISGWDLGPAGRSRGRNLLESWLGAGRGTGD
jgi:hypothetical protein